MDLLQNLNEQQRNAVTAPPGRILVLAGPGSGKTRVLTRRVSYLMQYMGVSPYHILCVTFTNKAAREMRKRVEEMTGGSIQGMWMGTFHSTCARILRREANFLPFDSNYVIMDSDDQMSLIKTVLKEENINDKQYRPYNIQAAISKAKNDLLSAEDLSIQTHYDRIVQRVYTRYQQMLLASNAVDFDDLMVWTVKLFDDFPSVKESYARQFEHILVDEFQDTNMVQYALLKQLSSYHNNLFVVGDEDQSIYRWRGADYRNILRFEKDFKGGQKILLEENYRSTQLILDAATSVIDQNSNRTPKDLQAARKQTGQKIILHTAYDDRDEAVFVVDTIKRLLDHQRAVGSDFAVMYRTNAQSRLIEEAFLKAGIDYRLVGAQRFYGRREIKDLIAYLRLIHNPDDIVSFTRVINVPKRGIGAKSLQSFMLAATKAEISAGEMLLSLGFEKETSPYAEVIPGRIQPRLMDFAEKFAYWREVKDDLNLPQLMETVIHDIEYENYLEEDSANKDSSIDRLANVHELRRLTFEYEEIGLEGFLENMALVSDQDTLPENVEAPTLLTLHAAKGLEFSSVFIIGLDQDILPHSRSLSEPEELAEERRLFYVGITRAQNNLYLTRADRRTNYGISNETIPSEFLKDIPEELIEMAGRAGTTRHHRRSVSSAYTSWDQTEFRPASFSTRQPEARKFAAVAQKYRAGMRVHSPKWGEGIVLESRVINGEETVDISFEDYGLKKVLADIVKLDILD